MIPRRRPAAYGRQDNFDETTVNGPATLVPARERELERQLAECERRISESQQRIAGLQAFAATVAHQLAGPLVIAESNAIFIEDELGDLLDDVTRDRLAVTARISARARLLIETLLFDARSADGVIRRRVVDSRRLVEETLELFSRQIEETGISIHVGPLPNIEAQPEMLGVVYQNLIANAIRYGARSAEIRLLAHREPDAWRFSVTSAGPTLRTEEAERIFEPFARAAGERRRGSYGLGLSICRSIVERHGGRIGVTPLPGTGNSFWFALPT